MSAPEKVDGKRGTRSASSKICCGCWAQYRVNNKKKINNLKF